MQQNGRGSGGHFGAVVIMADDYPAPVSVESKGEKGDIVLGLGLGVPPPRQGHFDSSSKSPNDSPEDLKGIVQ